MRFPQSLSDSIVQGWRGVLSGWLFLVCDGHHRPTPAETAKLGWIPDRPLLSAEVEEAAIPGDPALDYAASFRSFVEPSRLPVSIAWLVSVAALAALNILGVIVGVVRPVPPAG